MLVEWSTIIRREMEIKANSAKFRMQSNPTDWEQDTLLLSELFSFFFSFLLFSLFFFFFFFGTQNTIFLFFSFFHIYLIPSIYTRMRIHLVPDSLVYDDKSRGRLTFFENLSQLIYYHIFFFPFLFFFSFVS